MRIMSQFGLLFTAMTVIGLGIAASALAVEPVFNPTKKQTLTATSAIASILSTGGQELLCESNNVVGGKVENALELNSVVIHYLNCSWKKGEEESGCMASSKDATVGLILSNTLHAILGTILPQRLVGLLFLPEPGSVWFTLAASEKNNKKCNAESAVTGSVIAQILPVAKLQKTSTISFGPLMDIDLTHVLGLAKAKLTAFSENATLLQVESVTFSEETEVT
jgi:hypothetical protein